MSTVYSQKKQLRHFPIVLICNPLSYFCVLSRCAKFEVSRLMRSKVIVDTPKKNHYEHRLFA